MKVRKFSFLLLWLIAHPTITSASPSTLPNTPVFSKSGNIFYTQTPAHTIQITNTGKDSEPALSPNKEWVAFVRTTNQRLPKECTTNTEAIHGEQIWVYNVNTKKEKLLVDSSFQCNDPKEKIIDPKNLTFSPNNKMLYFMTSAWTTSGALHGVNIDGRHQHYITPANSFEVITKGTYKDYFIVNQHRYFIPPGGSYDWYWLISPDGKDEGAIGEEITSEQKRFLES